jgi:formylglycine-generating enzyme required for sulfatase activity
MKSIKYFLALGLFITGLTSCEKEPPTQDEIEAKWPAAITTIEAGDFVLVKRSADGFTMGDAFLATSSPEHLVKLSKSYYMCKTEVTQAQWKAIMGTNPSDNEGIIASGTNTDNCPVNNISQNDAQDFIKALNAATGRKYALPTEAQWEWAAMGGNLSAGNMFSGSNDMNEVAWTALNSDGYLNEVGKLKANELGIFDMTGNIEEWTADKYDSYKATEETDPTGSTSGSNYVSRGGYFNDSDADILSVKSRNKNRGSDKKYTRGLRLVILEPLSTEVSE